MSKWSDDDGNLSDEERDLLDKLVEAMRDVEHEERQRRIREYTHVVKVGAAKPGADASIDVWTPHDPLHAHALVEPELYMTLLDMGLIEFDEGTGYPRYIGTEPLR